MCAKKFLTKGMDFPGYESSETEPPTTEEPTDAQEDLENCNALDVAVSRIHGDFSSLHMVLPADGTSSSQSLLLYTS